MTVAWGLLIVMVIIGIVVQRRKREQFAFLHALLLLTTMIILSTIFIVTAIVLAYMFSSSFPHLHIGSLFLLYGLVIIIAGVFLYLVLRLFNRIRPLSVTTLTIIEYYIQWSLIYTTIYQIVFENLLRTLKIIKNVSSLTAVSANVLLVAGLSSFIASWIAVVLFKFTHEEI